MEGQRYTSKETDRHHFKYDAQLQELRTSFPGLPTSLQFFDLAECYQLQDLLHDVLPARSSEKQCEPQTFHNEKRSSQYENV